MFVTVAGLYCTALAGWTRAPREAETFLVSFFGRAKKEDWP